MLTLGIGQWCLWYLGPSHLSWMAWLQPDPAPTTVFGSELVNGRVLSVCLSLSLSVPFKKTMMIIDLFVVTQTNWSRHSYELETSWWPYDVLSWPYWFILFKKKIIWEAKRQRVSWKFNRMNRYQIIKSTWEMFLCKMICSVFVT